MRDLGERDLREEIRADEADTRDEDRWCGAGSGVETEEEEVLSAAGATNAGGSMGPWTGRGVFVVVSAVRRSDTVICAERAAGGGTDDDVTVAWGNDCVLPLLPAFSMAANMAAFRLRSAFT